MKVKKVAQGCYEVTIKNSTYRIQSYHWFCGSRGWQILLAEPKVSFIDGAEYVDYVWCNTLATKADCLNSLKEAL
jgi:hypothetical protein